MIAIFHFDTPSIAINHLTTTDKGKQSSLSEELTEYKKVNLPMTSMTTIFLL